MDYLKLLVKKVLQYEAKLVLKKYKPKVIAITGSVGKTLTREAIYSVLSKKFFVRKSENSFTAELGTALTVIGCREGVGSIFYLIENIFLGIRILLLKTRYPDWLILEIDADKPGDLKVTCSIIKPDILVLTALGEVPAHIELFETLETFLSEKKTIVDSVRRDGVIVYNADDNVVSSLITDSLVRKISCGVDSESDISGTAFEILYGTGKTGSVPTGMSFFIKSGSESYPINIFQSIGIQNEHASLLAFAVGREFGITSGDIIKSLNKYTSLPGRMNLVAGVKDTIIIDDSYNASPIAMSQAIEVLGNIRSVEKKIAVIGDMLELGQYSAQSHKKVAELLKDVATNVVCVGIRSRKIVDELLDLKFPESKVIYSNTSDEAGKFVQSIIDEGDIVLVKGSQTMRMERVVEEIMRHPSDKDKLLVRQNPEWLNRS